MPDNKPDDKERSTEEQAKTAADQAEQMAEQTRVDVATTQEAEHAHDVENLERMGRPASQAADTTPVEDVPDADGKTKKDADKDA